MGTGDNKPTVGALHRLRQRWLAPSPPLAVDDVPHWRPAADPERDQVDGEADSDGSVPSPATQ
jgi:hypothetical protein